MNKTILDLGSAEEPLVSIIIPVYNVAAYLPRCLDSVLNGEYQNIEVVCVDDGSPDECGTILDMYAVQDKRLVVLHQKNQGVAAARNNGLAVAKGEYIAFIDSDDFVHPLYIRTMMNCMLDMKADIVICSALKFNENEQPKDIAFRHIKYQRIDATTLFKHYYVRHMVWARIYQRKLLHGHFFTDEVQLADDTFFNLSIISELNNPRIYECSAELYYYFIRGNSIVHSAKPEKLIQIGNWYYNNQSSFTSTDDRWNWLILMEVIKTTLAYRYEMILEKNNKNVRHSRVLLESFLRKILHCKGINRTTKVQHYIMIKIPFLYRIFRIVQDPTMLIHEKNVRQRIKLTKQSR